MGGWKTWAGVAGIVASGVAHFFGYEDIAEAGYTFSTPVIIVGLGHKLDKILSVFKAVAEAVSVTVTKVEAEQAKAPKT